jgi:hypothetical protein
MIARMKAFEKADQLAAKFYPRDRMQRGWLVTAWVRATIELKQQTQLEDNYRKKLLKEQEAFSGAISTFDNAVGAGEAASALEIRKQILSQEALKKDRAALAYANMFFDVTTTELIPLHQDISLLMNFVNMSDQDWRNRKATDLETNIAELRQDQISGSLSPSELIELQKLKQQLAMTIDAVDQYKRAAVLRTFLSTIPQGKVTTTPPMTGPTMSEYSIARAEYETLLAKIQQKRAALQPPAKPKQLVAQTLRPPILWCDTGPANDQMIKTALSGIAPDANTPKCRLDADSTVDSKSGGFVIVIERGMHQ